MIRRLLDGSARFSEGKRQTSGDHRFLSTPGPCYPFQFLTRNTLTWTRHVTSNYARVTLPADFFVRELNPEWQFVPTVYSQQVVEGLEYVIPQDPLNSILLFECAVDGTHTPRVPAPGLRQWESGVGSAFNRREAQFGIMYQHLDSYAHISTCFRTQEEDEFCQATIKLDGLATTHSAKVTVKQCDGQQEHYSVFFSVHNAGCKAMDFVSVGHWACEIPDPPLEKGR
ncbi:hypothetical protein F5887DRAFT_1159668 [Amanita rubescens]|nr:hypothetical protein F5887DRAFT_1159668 [Amanita rubescens]